MKQIIQDYCGLFLVPWDLNVHLDIHYCHSSHVVDMARLSANFVLGLKLIINYHKSFSDKNEIINFVL